VEVTEEVLKGEDQEDEPAVPKGLLQRLFHPLILLLPAFSGILTYNRKAPGFVV
jgi:hypothetical protein